MQVFNLDRKLIDDYESFARILHRYPGRRHSPPQVDQIYAHGQFWPEPLMTINPRFGCRPFASTPRPFLPPNSVIGPRTRPISAQKAAVLRLRSGLPELCQPDCRCSPWTTWRWHWLPHSGDAATSVATCLPQAQIVAFPLTCSISGG